MTAAPRIFTPTVSLTGLLKEPGGATVGEALKRIEANLASLKPDCEAHLLAILERCEAIFARSGGTDAGGLEELYATALPAAGTGAVCDRPAVDRVLVSLFDLLQAATGEARGVGDAVRVHLEAWRLLLRDSLSPKDGEAILAGLRAVSARQMGQAGGTPARA